MRMRECMHNCPLYIIFSAPDFLRFKVHYFCVKEEKNILPSFPIILLSAGTLLVGNPTTEYF